MNLTCGLNITFAFIVYSLLANGMSALSKKLKFPFEISLVDKETNDELLKYFHGK